MTEYHTHPVISLPGLLVIGWRWALGQNPDTPRQLYAAGPNAREAIQLFHIAAGMETPIHQQISKEHGLVCYFTFTPAHDAGLVQLIDGLVALRQAHPEICQLELFTADPDG